MSRASSWRGCMLLSPHTQTRKSRDHQAKKERAKCTSAMVSGLAEMRTEAEKFYLNRGFFLFALAPSVADQ